MFRNIDQFRSELFQIVFGLRNKLHPYIFLIHNIYPIYLVCISIDYIEMLKVSYVLDYVKSVINSNGTILRQNQSMGHLQSFTSVRDLLLFVVIKHYF
jgi:hypothetical protein